MLTDKKLTRPLDLAALITTLVGTGINVIQQLNTPVADKIDDLRVAVDEAKKNPTPARIDDLAAQVSSLGAIHKAVTDVQSQIAEQAPVAVAAPKLPPVPTSTNKQWYESKKFQALLGSVVVLIVIPVLGNLGVLTPEQITIAQHGIEILGGSYLATQGTVDAISAHHDPPGPEQ